jgi:hypothetical protein
MMRKLLLAAIVSSIGGSASAQLVSLSAPLSPRAWPAGVSIPAIASNATVYPGCPTPPMTFGHVWYIDPLNGHTQTAGGLGTSAAPWDSLQALFGIKISGSPAPSTGYNEPLLSTAAIGGYPTGPIQPGDEVLLMNGNYGEISAGTQSVPTAQINNSPALTIAAAPGQIPVLSTLGLIGASGFVFNGLKIQSQNSDGAALVYIADGNNSGYVNTNFIFENMDISSAPVATALTWTPTQWIANARIGVDFAGSNQGSGLTCTSIVNSHIYVTHWNGTGAINVQANNSLVQNNQLDHFSNSGITYDASNVAILGNYIYDAFNSGEFDYKGAVLGLSLLGNLIPHQNIYVSLNEIVDDLDPALPSPPALQGIIASNGDWTNLVITRNLIASSGCGSIVTGNAHNGLIANNSIVDGGNSSLQPGCVPSIDVLQAHGGTTGPQGLIPSNIRITGNITPYMAFAGSNVTADHNVITGLGNYGFVYSPWGVNGVNGNLYFNDNPTIGSVTIASSVSGVENIHDGLGQTNEFTSVPTAGSFPMSPAPNWTPKSGSPARTYGGAALIPPISDFNGLSFSPPYSIGALN